MSSQSISLNQLWQSVVSTEQVFEPKQFAHLPESSQRYLQHAIQPRLQLANAVRLQMEGEIKLKKWQPFKAEQVIDRNRGMIWRALTWLKGVPIRVEDRIVDGQGAMRLKLLGLFPFFSASGANITRSAIGRMQGESVWLPSIFCDQKIKWTAVDENYTGACLTLMGETTQLRLKVNQIGQLEQISWPRWGNPEGEEHHYLNFGGYLEEEKTFSGYTIPTRCRIGWYFGSERFDAEGEFFRATIQEAIYR